MSDVADKGSPPGVEQENGMTIVQMAVGLLLGGVFLASALPKLRPLCLRL